MSGDGLTRRQRELQQVAEAHHTVWLAGQIDEVEDQVLVKITELSAALDHNTKVVSENTKEQVDTRQRFTWLALTVALTVLTGAIAAIIAGAIG